jgi:hypothetical protein
LTFAATPALTELMRCVFYLWLAAGLLLLFGCARGKPPAAHAVLAPAAAGQPASGQKLIVTPDQGLDGRIAWVNSNLQFVVITFPIGQMPAVDQRLNIYRHGLKVGEVRITGPQNDDSIVGDILAGEAAPGDSIRDR